MAVRHVTIYECDACKESVDEHGLVKVQIGSDKMDLCSSCTRKVQNLLASQRHEPGALPPHLDVFTVDEEKA